MTLPNEGGEHSVEASGGLLTTGLARGPLSGEPGRHVVLSSSAAVARLLGTTQSALVGADLQEVLCDAHDRRSLDGWRALQRQLESKQEGAAQLPLPPAADSFRDERWLDVSVAALPGGRYAWSCETGPAAGATAAQRARDQHQQHQRAERQWQAEQLPQLSPLDTAALAVLPQPVWVCDAAGRVVYANAAFCRVAACDERGAQGRPWTHLLPQPQPTAPADVAAVQRLQAAVAAGQAAQEEVHCGGAGRQLGSNRCSSSITVAPLQLSSSTARLAVCTLLGGPASPHFSGSSIGVPRHAGQPAATASPPASPGSPPGSPPAAALHAVPQPLAKLCNQALASTSEGVVITDPTQPGNPMVWANAAFERMTGHSLEAVLGRSHSLLQGPDTDPLVLADIAAAMDEGRPVVAELLTYRRDGTAFWAQVSITPIRDPATGAVANFVAVQRDISARKAVEAASHVREQALSNLNEGICICDATIKDCPVVYVNSAFLRITGYSRKEIVGRNCRFLQGPATDPATVSKLATALHEGREITVELLNYRKSGEEFTNLLSITPVRDAAGRLLSFIGVQSDITELVRRRAAEKELQEAKVAAETAAEAKSMFLANMSHEIRTPLNGMIAVAQLLLSSGLTPEQRELADTILESGNTLLTILGDILDFSKIDHNQMVLESAPLALRDTFESSIEMAAADAARKGLDVAYRLAPPLVARCLLGDSIRIRQVLANLLSNAVKFTSQGEVVVDGWVEASPAPSAANAAGGAAAPASDGRQRLHVAVRDTGIGISHASMQRLFQQFRQGHESMSRWYGGTGLGLAISRRLAQLMGGDVWAESVEGHGSTFHFTMELAWEGDVAAAAGAAPAGPAVAQVAVAAAGTADRDASSSFDSSLGKSDSLSASRRGSGSGEQQRQHTSGGSAGTGGDSASAAAASAGGDAGEGSGAAGSGSGPRAEEARLLLQQHHEALLQRLAQRTTAAAEGGDSPTAGLRLSEAAGPDTPVVPRVPDAPARGGGAFSSASSSSMLASLGGGGTSVVGSCRSLGTLAANQRAAASKASSEATLQQRSPRVGGGTRDRAETALAAAPAARPRGSGDSVQSCPERVSTEQARRPRMAHPTVDYRISSFYSPSQPVVPAKPPSKPARQPSSPTSAAAAQAAAAALPGSPAAPPPAPPSTSAAAAAAPADGPALATPAAHPRRSSGDCGGSSASAPMATAPLPPRPASQSGAACDWSGPAGGSVESAVLRGRQVCVDIAHGPTAVQVAQSCRLLGMEVSMERCHVAPPHPVGCDGAAGAGREFCITTADKALEAVRAGWRSHPLVVLGRRDEVPSNLQPLATTVSKPVKHARLVGALLKAAAFSTFKQQVPLHTDPTMLSLMPERNLLNSVAGGMRRISLDNSALDRRRWEAAASAAAAAAANAEGMLEPVRASAPTPGRAADGAGQQQLHAAFQGGSGRGSIDGAARGAGGWQPELSVIHSDGSRESSVRNSLDVGAPGAQLQAVQEHAQAGGCPEQGAAPAAPADSGAAGGSASAGGRPPRILVAEDNLINQRVISKVLQRCVPAATVEIVGNGVEALAAVHRTSFDLVLMDIHMPEMDGLEASRRLQAELPADRRPVVVALSADTLQELHQQCRDAGIREFICKPFRIEDVQRVLALVGPRLRCSFDGLR